MKKTYNQYILIRLPVICIAVMILASIVNFLDGEVYVAFVEFVIGVAILVYILMTYNKRSKDIQEFMSMLTQQSGDIANEVLLRFPLPMLVCGIDGMILWYNQKAAEMLGKNHLYDISLPQLVPELKWSDILKTTDSINIDIEYNERKYIVLGNIIKRSTDKTDETLYSVLLYFDDITEINSLKTLYAEEKVDIAIVTIDNYEDVFQTMDDVKSQSTVNKINSIISKWVTEANGIMKKLESGKYQVFFEHRYLDEYIKNKFDILEKVRAVGDEIKEPITISIGIGTGGSLTENEAYARNSVEMAWGRGGDQAAIKTDGAFKFYGGNAKDYEKSTRVKTRMFSTALREMITYADKVIIMGHMSADYDSFGSAIGLSRAVRLLGKEAFIILDNSPAIKQLYEEMENKPDYNSMVISPNTALETATKETLVIVVDTHRPSMLPAPELLDSVNKIVLIDHHRRSTEFLENVSLSYLEPYASSTCEMVTEILQYIDEKKNMSEFEAKALYVGILMDTKNFVTKTGVRTFEAASYLKRYGVNTMEVKNIFNLNFDEYVKRTDIIKKAEIWNGDIAVSVCNEAYNNMRAVSSQAADEMLNISGIKVAFVIYPIERDNKIAISARSFGEVNVQLIMEKLGGGGHMTVAACQIKNVTVNEGRQILKDVIKEYIEENKK